MGESNPDAMNLITELTGHTPVYGETEDGEQSLTIGEFVIVATRFCLWGDPTAYQHNDRTLTVSWGGQSATLVKNDDGSWDADIIANALQGTARFVD
jgi:hypothetical protein